jgi:quercetin dioxygenase-like cupin family protein
MPRSLQGDAFIVPAKIKHQIEATQDFKAVHVMPDNIKFESLKGE